MMPPARVALALAAALLCGGRLGERVDGLRFASAPIPTTCRSPTAPAKDSRTGSPSCWPPIAGARLEYTWWPQRRGFVRNTLAAGALRRA